MSARDHTWIALLHHPVVDKHGNLVATSVTNLDVHDIARAARTYGLAGYFVVTPIDKQRALVQRIVGHWRTPQGKARNDSRTEALSLVHVVDTLDSAVAHVARAEGTGPALVATGARPRAGTVPIADYRQSLNDSPRLILFGTGWGLAPAVFQRADTVLSPIDGAGDYNHLSVRTAVAIVLDRLFGMR